MGYFGLAVVCFAFGYIAGIIDSGGKGNGEILEK